MRTYPRNSPDAAARIVALVLIADGHVSRSEIDALQQLDIERTLGLQPGRFGEVLHALCEDLLLAASGNGGLIDSVDHTTLASLMAEVDCLPLQRKVLDLAAAAAGADQHLAESEAMVMAAARKHWQISATPQDSANAAPLALAA